MFPKVSCESRKMANNPSVGESDRPSTKTHLVYALIASVGCRVNGKKDGHTDDSNGKEEAGHEFVEADKEVDVKAIMPYNVLVGRPQSGRYRGKEASTDWLLLWSIESQGASSFVDPLYLLSENEEGSERYCTDGCGRDGNNQHFCKVDGKHDYAYQLGSPMR